MITRRAFVAGALAVVATPLAAGALERGGAHVGACTARTQKHERGQRLVSANPLS